MLGLRVDSAGGEADLELELALRIPGSLPEGSPFADEREARRFAGPLPFTFEYEKETHSIFVVEGVRENWSPQLVNVRVLKNTFFESTRFGGVKPVYASAFSIENIPYRWKPGFLEPIP